MVTVGSLSDLRHALERLRLDVAIIDIGIAADEKDVLLTIVRNARTALIAVAVRDLATRVELLLAGADDCLPALYAPEELTARVIAIVRRTYRAAPQDVVPVLQSGAVRLDLRARRAEVRGSEAVWGIGYRFCTDERQQLALTGSVVSADQEHGGPIP
ncbi:MAG: hypothetical protein M3Q39_13845 [Actinomycetota bacterium]|nr:hypothetical protein [Actinomycetota bacterium]